MIDDCPYLFYRPNTDKLYRNYLHNIDNTIKTFQRDNSFKEKYNVLANLDEILDEMNQFWLEYEELLDNYIFNIPGVSDDEGLSMDEDAMMMNNSIYSLKP